MDNSHSAGHGLVKVLVREGVHHVFNVPGESFLAALDGFFDAHAITLVTNRHEGGACYMAEAYAKLTGKPGVCFVTRGPGATHASVGVHCAHQDSTPLVLLIGQVPRYNLGREAFQEMDYSQFFGKMTKAVLEPLDAQRVPESVQWAFHLARSGRPGPVVVVLPEDTLRETYQTLPPPPFHLSPPSPDPQGLATLRNALDKAKRPLLLVGAGVQHGDARHSLLTFAQRFGLTTLSSFRRMDAFPNLNPHYGGSLDLGSKKSPARQTFDEADFVLVLGDRLSDITTGSYRFFHPKKPLWQVDIDPAVMGQNIFPQGAIISDAAAFLKGMLAQPEPLLHSDRSAWTAACHARYLAWVEPRDRPSAKVSMEFTLKALRQVLPKDTLFTVDAGNSSAWVQRYWPFDEAHSFLGPTVGSMGYGLPAAIAASLAQPNRTVVGTSGDGAFLMTAQELSIAVEHNLNLVHLVFNNQALGTIRMHQEREYPNRTVGTDLCNPSFAQLARSYGACGLEAGHDEEVIPALKEALAFSGPAVIDVQTDLEQLSVSQDLQQLRPSKP